MSLQLLHTRAEEHIQHNSSMKQQGGGSSTRHTHTVCASEILCDMTVVLNNEQTHTHIEAHIHIQTILYIIVYIYTLWLNYVGKAKHYGLYALCIYIYIYVCMYVACANLRFHIYIIFYPPRDQNRSGRIRPPTQTTKAYASNDSKRKITRAHKFCLSYSKIKHKRYL